MSQVGVGHLAVADDPGYRDVVVRSVVGPELVPRVARDLLQNRTGRLGGLALADQESHQTALSDGAGGEKPAQTATNHASAVAVVNVVVDDECDEHIGVEQDGGHLIVLQRADVFGSDLIRSSRTTGSPVAALGGSSPARLSPSPRRLRNATVSLSVR